MKLFFDWKCPDRKHLEELRLMSITLVTMMCATIMVFLQLFPISFVLSTFVAITLFGLGSYGISHSMKQTKFMLLASVVLIETIMLNILGFSYEFIYWAAISFALLDLLLVWYLFLRK